MTHSRSASALASSLAPTLQPLEPRVLLAAAPAAWSDRFVDSIGVMVHSDYWDTAYNPIQPSLDAIEDIGFRHLRGMIAPFYDRLDPGFQVIAYADARDANGYVDPSPDAVAGVLQQIKDANTRPQDVVAIEGPNEYNGSNDPNKVDNLNGFMQELHTQMRADPWFDHVALLGPSMNYTKANYGQFGSQADYLDAVNLHNYGFAGQWQSNEFAINREWPRNQANTDHLPAWVTETGYNYNSTGDAAQGRYWPRMYFGNWNRGVIKTVGYELVAIGDGKWGILNSDYSYRNAATAIKNTIGLLDDSAAGNFVGGALDFDLLNAEDDVEYTLLQKADGKFYLTLWRGVTNNGDPEFAADNLTVQFNHNVSSVKHYQPNFGTGSSNLSVTNNAVSLGVTDAISILEITLNNPANPPTAPGGFTATAKSATAASLSWNNTSGALGYQIERTDGRNPWHHIGFTTSTSYTDATLQPGRSYAYRVVAVNEGGGTRSTEKNITTPDSTVTIDHLADFSNTTGGSGWELRTDSYSSNMRDPHWVKRTTDNTADLVWNVSDLDSFFATFSMNENVSTPTSSAQFFTSSDGSSWSPLTTDSTRSEKQGGWEIVNIYNDALLPTNTNYLKLELSGDQDHNRLLQLKLVHGNGTGTYSSPNQQPTANDDEALAGPGETVLIDVLANDREPDPADDLTITHNGSPAHGTTTTVNGQVQYTPDAGFAGTDTFTYTVSDGRGGTDSATVTVTVPEIFHESFADGNANGWLTTGNGDWSVSHDQRLRVERLGGWSNHHAFWDQPAAYNWSNYAFEADVNTFATTTQPNVGLNFYVQDTNDYYQFYVADNSDQAVLRKSVNGSFTNLATASGPQFNRGDHEVVRLRVEAKDGVIHASMDGVDLFGAVSDSTFNKGTVGLYGRGHINYFDNLAVFDLDATNPGPGPGGGTVLLSETFDAGSAVDSQSDFESVFHVETVSSNRWTYDGSAGSSGGGIDAPTGQLVSAIHKTGVAGFGTHDTLTLSLDTEIVGTGSPGYPSVDFYGMLKDSTAFGPGGLGFGLDYVAGQNPKFNVVARNGSANTVLGTIDFGASSWYRWDAAWTHTSGNSFGLDLKLYDISGGSDVLVDSWTTAGLTNAAMASASQVYAGFDGRSRNSIGVETVDRLQIEAPGVGTTELLGESFDAGSSVDSQGDLESIFNVDTKSGNKWQYDGNNGPDGSGALVAPTGQVTSAVHKTGVAGFGTHSSLTLSMETEIVGTGSPGFSTIDFYGMLKDNSAVGVGGLGFGLDYVAGQTDKFNVVARNGSTNTVLGTINFSTAAWYRWDATWTHTGGNDFTLDLKLYDISGTSDVLVDSWTATGLTNGAMAAASQVYAGFDGRSRNDIGVATVDNLRILA